MMAQGRSPSAVPALKGVSLGTVRGAAIKALGKPASFPTGRDTEHGPGVDS